MGGWGWGGENLGGFCDLRARKLGVDRVLCEDQSGDRDFDAEALLVTGWAELGPASHLSARQFLLALFLAICQAVAPNPGCAPAN